MKDIAIRVQGLGKKYRIGKKRQDYRTLRDTLAAAFSVPFVRAAKLLRGEATGASERDESIWALKDLCFEIKEGEVVGIIGANGAGKSTLLKILSRITEPTRGFAEIRGRVGSLLEVGTGFHPELTGRENIYLNGAILGMKRVEINRNFDEIVSFAEVERFIDTPVKHYSSGMYLRLAFSVAAHMEPEILMIDEVLAVGDAAFQKKCLGKMGDVAKGGRTVLFVSHSFVAVESLCPRTLLVHQGTLAADGRTRDVIERYLTDISCSSGTHLSDRKDRQGAGEIRTTAIEFLDHKGGIIQHPVSGQELIVRMHYESLADKAFKNCEASIAVTRNEIPYFILSTEVVDARQLELCGSGYIDFIVPELPLSQSTYALHSCIKSNQEVHDWVVGAAEMSVVDGDFYGTGKGYPSELKGRGVLVRHSWRGNNGHETSES